MGTGWTKCQFVGQMEADVDFERVAMGLVSIAVQIVSASCFGDA